MSASFSIQFVMCECVCVGLCACWIRLLFDDVDVIVVGGGRLLSLSGKILFIVRCRLVDSDLAPLLA